MYMYIVRNIHDTATTAVYTTIVCEDGNCIFSYMPVGVVRIRGAELRLGRGGAKLKKSNDCYIITA